MFIIPVKWLKYLEAQGITDPEDIKGCLDATGIEISVMYEDGDVEHEGYYDSINDAISALISLSKLHPQLIK